MEGRNDADVAHTLGRAALRIYLVRICVRTIAADTGGDAGPSPDRQASGGSLPWWSDQRGERPQSGEAKGVGYELGKELARRMGVPYEPLIYQTPKLLVEDVNSGKWDISFVAQDPDRERILNFTTVYLSLEHGYLVPSGSPIQTINDVDRAGIRVGVPAGGSVIAPLKRTLKDAQIIEVGMPEAADLVQSGKVDVFAANKANLFAIADRLPGSRVLEGRFSVDRFALGLPKGREAGLAYVRKFIENAKSEGLVKSAAERAGVRGAVQE